MVRYKSTDYWFLTIWFLTLENFWIKLGHISSKKNMWTVIDNERVLLIKWITSCKRKQPTCYSLKKEQNKISSLLIIRMTLLQWNQNEMITGTFTFTFTRIKCVFPWNKVSNYKLYTCITNTWTFPPMEKYFFIWKNKWKNYLLDVEENSYKLWFTTTINIINFHRKLIAILDDVEFAQTFGQSTTR